MSWLLDSKESERVKVGRLAMAIGCTGAAVLLVAHIVVRI